MKMFVRLWALCVLACSVSQAQTVNYVQSSGLPTGACQPTFLYENDSNGSLYTCVNGSWASSVNASSMNNTVWMDGVKYPWTAAGLRQAIVDANGHSGVAGVVRIGSTANGILTNGLQQIELDGNTITVPSFTYIVGDARDATGIDFIGKGLGTNSAFDFPPGTHGSGLINLGIELDGGATGTCITFEGTSAFPTYSNIIQNVACGNGFPNGTQQGIVLTPTPTGANGAIYIHDNIFQNIWFSGYNGNGIKLPIVSNGDYSNKFTGITSDNPLDGTSTFSGHFENDRLELTVHKQNSLGITALSLASDSTGNIIDLYCDLGQTIRNFCVDDQGGGNHIVVSNLNLTPLGIPNPNSFTENLSPLPRVATVYLPSDTRLHGPTGVY